MASKQLTRWYFPLAAAVAFFVVLSRLWIVQDLIHYLPGYGDVLENIWMFESAARSLFEQHRLPVFFPDVFVPRGWYASGWTNGFFIYVVGAPLAWLGSPAFAFNTLTLLSFAVNYVGSLYWLRRHMNGWLAIALSVFLTFSDIHWVHGSGHIHFLWMLAWMPWLVNTLELAHEAAGTRRHWPNIRAGIFWAAMIYGTPYGLFFGAAIVVPFLLVWIVRSGTRLRAIEVSGSAALFSLPYLILFYMGLTYNGSQSYGLEHAQAWSASVNALFAPSVYHVHSWMRELSNQIYSGTISEASITNLGISACIVGLIGAALALPKRGLPRLHLAITAIGLFMGLGMMLTWNGDVPQFKSLVFLDNALWQVGRRIRPSAFNTVLAPGVFAQGVPLPGYLIHMLLPFTESARVWSRYINITLLGMAPLIGAVLARIPRLPQVLLSLLIVYELFPLPGGNVPVPTSLSPAYDWLAQQPKGAVLDVRKNGAILIGGEIIYAQNFHHQPIASGLGSYLPPDLVALQTYLMTHGGGMGDPELPKRAYELGVRYIVLHLQNGDTFPEEFKANPNLKDIDCFSPASNSSPINYPVCVSVIQP